MIDTYHGTSTQRALHKLHRRGYVVRHAPPPEEPNTAGQWVLTPAGLIEAERILDALGREEL